MLNATGLPPERLAQPQEPLLSFIADGHLALVLPIVVYWLMSLGYQMLDTFELAEKYRIHTQQEVDTRNRCTPMEVVRAVLAQQAIQVVLGVAVGKFEPIYTTGHESYEVWRIASRFGISIKSAEFWYWYVSPTLRMVWAFFLMDTWQYMLHRAMHLNKWAYRNFHSVHHRLYVPYAYGALYNSLVEGFLLDTVGALISGSLAFMSPRELIMLYTFSTMKTVDDHCGYEFPWDPLQWAFPNRSTYHDIHHQPFGIKTNFSQPYFVHWDLLLGSKYAKSESYIAKSRREREAAYAKKKALKAAEKKARKLKAAGVSSDTVNIQMRAPQVRASAVASEAVEVASITSGRA